MISNDFGNDVAFISISVCNNYEPYYTKPTWTYLSHKPVGNIVYIEKIVSREWNRKLRNLIEDKITQTYPTVQYAMWARPKTGLNDDVIIQYKVKRRSYVSNQSLN